MANPHVLLVEDDAMSRFMMSEILDVLGFSFEVAEDGQECVEILTDRPHAFDAVLMDIHMPRKTGLEAVLEIRKAETDPPRNIHVVAVSADLAWQNVEKARRAGFNDVLPKPVHMKSISAVLA